jgi:endonuclease VIII
MPEGDTVYRAARVLDAALTGADITRSDIRVPAFATVDLAGQTVHSVASRGKHLLMRIGELTVHSHLKMEGRWRVYQRGERWDAPAYTARIILETAEVQAVGFELGLLEIVPTADEEDVVGYLGPDLLGPDWDAAGALANLLADSRRPVAIALLDQRNLAGLGNVYKNELCFLRGVLPQREIGTIPEPERMVDLAHRLIVANRDRQERTTTGNTRRGQRLYVHGRRGQPCRRCGTPISYGELGDAGQERQTFWCPVCQS